VQTKIRLLVLLHGHLDISELIALDVELLQYHFVTMDFNFARLGLIIALLPCLHQSMLKPLNFDILLSLLQQQGGTTQSSGHFQLQQRHPETNPARIDNNHNEAMAATRPQTTATEKGSQPAEQ
jgi:hypothetical protein